MANPKLNFAHICDYASFSDGGKLNVLGIFKNINTKNLPAIHPQIFIVTNILVNSGKRYKEIIKLIKEDSGQQLGDSLVFDFSLPFNDTQIETEVSFVGQLAGVNFQEAGKYYFEIYIDEILLRKIPFEVKKI